MTNDKSKKVFNGNFVSYPKFDIIDDIATWHIPKDSVESPIFVLFLGNPRLPLPISVFFLEYNVPDFQGLVLNF
ncbi:hypothetical protein QYF36_009880 [Acer negundo]|nr:hypothetical protein QYF36_009880 [Acer negundo]